MPLKKWSECTGLPLFCTQIKCQVYLPANIYKITDMFNKTINFFVAQLIND